MSLRTILNEKNAPDKFFIVFFSFCIVLMLTLLFITNGSFLADIVWDGRTPLFADFEAIYKALSRKPYDVGEISYANAFTASYPPFAYFCYYIIARMIPDAIRDSNVDNWRFLFSDIILCLNLALIVVAARKIIKHKSSLYFVIFILCFIISHPFAFAVVKAANSTLWVLTLICLSLYLRDSPSRFYKELALIFLAFAAGLKITPAVLGLLYLKEKRFKEAVRLTVYGIVFFILPFFFFGGLSVVKTYVGILSMVSNLTQPRPETIVGVCLEIADVCGWGSSTGLAIGKSVTALYFVMVIVLFCLTKLNWKSHVLLSSCLIILANHSYPYTLIYLLPPILFFIKETSEKFYSRDYVYAVFFVLILCGHPFIKIDWPTASFITNYFWLYIFIFTLVCDKICEIVKIRGRNCA